MIVCLVTAISAVASYLAIDWLKIKAGGWGSRQVYGPKEAEGQGVVAFLVARIRRNRLGPDFGTFGRRNRKLGNGGFFAFGMGVHAVALT